MKCSKVLKQIRNKTKGNVDLLLEVQSNIKSSRVQQVQQLLQQVQQLLQQVQQLLQQVQQLLQQVQQLLQQISTNLRRLKLLCWLTLPIDLIATVTAQRIVLCSISCNKPKKK